LLPLKLLLQKGKNESPPLKSPPEKSAVSKKTPLAPPTAPASPPTEIQKDSSPLAATETPPSKRQE
jgi:hypothetical protein